MLFLLIAAVAGLLLAMPRLRVWTGFARIQTTAQAPAVVVAPTLPESGENAELKRLMTDTDKIRRCLSDAETLSSDGLYDKAIELLLLQMKSTPEALELKEAMARYLALNGRTDSALSLIFEVLHAVPQSEAARQLLARIYLLRKEGKPAYEVIQGVLQADPQNADALEIAIRSSLLSDRPDIALQHIKTLLLIRPNDIGARQMAGVAYLRMANFAKASYQFSELIRIHPTDPVNHLNLSICYAQQGNVQETVNILHRAINTIGTEQVAPWLESDGFDHVRESALFQAFMDEVAARSSVPAVQKIEEPGDVARGILPTSPIPSRRLDLK